MAHVRVTVELVPDDQYGEPDRHNQTVVCATDETLARAIESAARRARAAADDDATLPRWAESVVIDHEAVGTARAAEALTIDGEPFPWAIADAPVVGYSPRWVADTVTVEMLVVGGQIEARGASAGATA